MKERYGLLRVMAVIYKILAWVSIVVAVFTNTLLSVAIGGLATPQLGAAVGVAAGFGAWILLAVYALIVFGTLYGLSEAIYLLFDVEEETRATEEKVTGMRPAA
jgi:hypothetical protein